MVSKGFLVEKCSDRISTVRDHFSCVDSWGEKGQNGCIDISLGVSVTVWENVGSFDLSGVRGDDME